MKHKELPSQEELLQLFTYEPDTGVLRWRRALSNRVKVGDVAGCDNWNGYLVVRIRGTLFYIHRIVWKMVHGDDPIDKIDHINLDMSNNRIMNLRECSNSQNLMNGRRRKNNTSGIVGVSFDKKDSKWRARVMRSRKEINLGYFKSKEDAAAARRAGELTYFGEFARRLV